MFENLLHQDRVRDLLKQGLTTGRLPPSILFAGPAHSGKMTAALELARAMNCKNEDAPWSCTCASCSRHRLLDSPHMLLMGRRCFSDEINAAGRMLLQGKSAALQFLFHRNVKKLIRRFDPLLWDDRTKLNKADKLIDLIDLNTPTPDLTALNARVLEIEKLLPADGVNISMIRKAIYWARTADRSVTKVIILENAENLNESCRNALLKILEEPPPELFFILTSERPESIIPTIRSRLGTFRFIPRTREDFQYIISRVYRCAGAQQYSSIQAFFDHSTGLDTQKRRVALMLTLLRERDISARDELVRELGSDRRVLKQLIMLCLEELENSGSTDCLEMQRKLEEMNHRSEVYNIPVASALEHGYI